MNGVLERFNEGCTIRGDRMAPIHFCEAFTASHMPSQAWQRLLGTAAAPEGYGIQSWDVSGAYMKALKDPRFRVTMKRPPRGDGTYSAPGKVCILRRAMPNVPEVNGLWDAWSDRWLGVWGWNEVLSESSMFWFGRRRIKLE